MKGKGMVIWWGGRIIRIKYRNSATVEGLTVEIESIKRSWGEKGGKTKEEETRRLDPGQ